MTIEVLERSRELDRLVALAEQRAARPYAAAAQRPEMTELGAPGQAFWSGFLTTDEYVPELMGVAALSTYERMRRSDGMVRGSLRALKLPLLGATWDVEPATSDESDVTIANFVRWNFFEGMSMPWSDHLRQVLTHLDFGHYVAEKVWEIKPSLRISTEVYAVGDTTVTVPAPKQVVLDRPMLIIRKLAPRLQRTLYRWNLSDDGGLISITQQIYAGQSTRTVDIPVDKVLVFVNDKEGAGWTGQSVLRPAYKHWFMNDQLYRIQAIAAERHGVGVPVLSLPESEEDPKLIQRAEDIGSSIRAHERGYVVEIRGMKFRIEGMGQGRPLDVLPAILQNDRRIALAILTSQFVTLGDQPGGSNGMSEDQSGFFLMVERALGSYIADIHNRYLIPQLVDANFTGVTRYPRLVVRAIETREAFRVINALAQAVGVGLVTPDVGLENGVRALVDFPPRGADAAPPERKAALPAPTPAPADGGAP
jgi:hypothetical protein